MNQSLKIYALRESIINALSDEEVARVSHAESGVHLAAGDEYLDLAELEFGIRKSTGAKVDLRNSITRATVGEKTWALVLGLLSGPNAVQYSVDVSPTPRNT